MPHVPKIDALHQEKMNELLEHLSVLSHRASRDVFRRELRRNARFYATLSRKHPIGSAKRKNYRQLSLVHQEVLAVSGEEAPPKPRRTRPRTSISYPDLPEALPLRVHFLAEGSLRRERAVALGRHGERLIP
jgi:hypothetical protein